MSTAPAGLDAPASSPVPAAPTRGRRVLPVAAGLAGLAVAIATVVLDVLAAGVPTPGLDQGWSAAVTGLALLLPGLLLTTRLPGHGVARVLVGAGSLWLVVGAATSWAARAVYVDPTLPGAAPALFVYLRFGAFLIAGLPLLLLVFPDGRLPTGRVLRPAALLGLGSTLLLPVSLLLVPSAVIQRYHDEPLAPALAPLDVAGVLDLPFWPVVLTVAYAALPLSMVVPLVVVVLRYRAAAGERRLQLRWLVWAGIVDVPLVVGASVAGDPVSGLLFCAAVAVTSAAVVVAVARYHLYEIDRLIPTTVVSLLLAGLVGLVDVVLLLVAGSVLGGRDSVLVAVAVVAVAYTPLRNRLWATARRITRGGRDDPQAAVTALAARLESTADPDEQLGAVARSVVEAFRLSYVAVEIVQRTGERVRVQHGTARGAALTMPMTYRGETIGSLTVDAAGALSPRDQRLMGDLVRQAAAAVRASAMAAELAEARTRMVTAVAEDRRRLRRDLHDGLGPGLGAVSLRIETARNLLRRDPDEADRMLVTARDDLGGALADLRRVVHDLRPPVLDDLGLRGAVVEQARRLAAGSPTDVAVEGPDPGPLPAAVEVAAYRIASEALTNVVRHAEAARARVRLDRTTAVLVVEVVDDGRGVGPDTPAGVGTLSLRERAAELGGTCTVTCPADGGTVVRAELPLPGGSAS